MGRSTDDNNLLLDKEDLKKRGIKLREIRRGGDITYHGPGQIVGYPIFDLKQHKKDAHWYLRSLEEVLIETIGEYGLDGYTIDGMTGVWCDGGKVAAIGVGISKWVTTHGFALNVNTDLGYFGGIIPCGLKGKQVNSLQALLRKNVDLEEVKGILVHKFSDKFKLTFENNQLYSYLG